MCSCDCDAPWTRKFPDVSFNDKVVVVFSDGSLKNLKHLYHDNSELHEIDWDSVSQCHEI